MLEKFIIHLKNIIFFKLVMYFLFISILIWIVRDFEKNYLESASTNHNAQVSLAEETLKLYSIISSKSKILETYKKYTELLSISSMQRCLKKVRIIKDIESLSSKYHLQEPISTIINQIFLRDVNQVIHLHEDEIKVKNYKVQLKFATPDFLTALAIIKDAQSNMPDKTIVISARIQKQSVLESKLIYKLSENKFPELVFTKLTMRLREIIIRK